MKNIIAIVVIVLLIGAGVWYYLNNRPAQPAEPATTQEAQGTQSAQIPPQEGVGEAPVGDAAYVTGNLVLGIDGSTTVGPHLIGYNGMTLYTFALDSTTKSACTGGCATNWPPYTVPTLADLANIQAGVTGKVSSLTREDGSLQVTYNSKPVYFYAKDTTSGDTKGQGVGGVWYVVKP